MILICSSCRASCLFFVPSDKHQLLEGRIHEKPEHPHLVSRKFTTHLDELEVVKDEVEGDKIASPDQLPMVLDEL
jgi:hypothetical protein